MRRQKNVEHKWFNCCQKEISDLCYYCILKELALCLLLFRVRLQFVLAVYFALDTCYCGPGITIRHAAPMIMVVACLYFWRGVFFWFFLLVTWCMLFALEDFQLIICMYVMSSVDHLSEGFICHCPRKASSSCCFHLLSPPGPCRWVGSKQGIFEHCRSPAALNAHRCPSTHDPGRNCTTRSLREWRFDWEVKRWGSWWLWRNRESAFGTITLSSI